MVRRSPSSYDALGMFKLVAVNEANYRNNNHCPNDENVHPTDKLCGNRPLAEISKPCDCVALHLSPPQDCDRDCDCDCNTKISERRPDCSVTSKSPATLRSSSWPIYGSRKGVHDNIYNRDETS